jgi:thiol-disulfide isomerase/thioredoxin
MPYVMVDVGLPRFSLLLIHIRRLPNESSCGLCRLLRSKPPPLGKGASRRKVIAASADKAAALAELKKSQDGLSAHLDGVHQAIKDGNAPAPKGASALDSVDETDLEEIFIDNFHDRIKNSGTSVVMVDFYTKWCGPCKLIYPKLVELKAKHEGQVRLFVGLALLHSLTTMLCDSYFLGRSIRSISNSRILLQI